jgi:hypothetical protein
MADYTGTPIPADQAWRIFGDWKSSGREIGAIFWGCSGTNILTMGFLTWRWRISLMGLS